MNTIFIFLIMHIRFLKAPVFLTMTNSYIQKMIIILSKTNNILIGIIIIIIWAISTKMQLQLLLNYYINMNIIITLRKQRKNLSLHNYKFSINNSMTIIYLITFHSLSNKNNRYSNGNTMIIKMKILDGKAW